MVSLQRSTNTNAEEDTTYFGNSETLDDRDLQPILGHYGSFKPLKTILPFAAHTLYIFVLQVMSIIFTFSHPDQNCLEYYIIIYTHSGLWFLTLLVDQIARMKHHDLRVNGYLEFYKTTHVHHSLPFYVVSLWSTVIILIQTVMQQFYADNFKHICVKSQNLSPISYLCAFVTVEFCVLLGINLTYIISVNKFNKMKLPPDVQRDEWSSAANPETIQPDEIGYRRCGDKFYNFIEKQADLIRHLQEYNEKLSEKIVLLNEIKVLQNNRNFP